ncbi:hypothetical protein [Acetobacter aceti]|uniref:hypothetical protein n=1 Tax=Acetobacter aceti TaxID=435 RepID=UPI0016255CF7|nr:hypothetical protein [Acetobacter aceti]
MNTFSGLRQHEHLIRILGFARVQDLAGTHALVATTGGTASVCALDLLSDPGNSGTLGLWSPTRPISLDIRDTGKQDLRLCLDAVTGNELLGPTPFMTPATASDRRRISDCPDVVITLGVQPEDWKDPGIGCERRFIRFDVLLKRLFPDCTEVRENLDVILARLGLRPSCPYHPASLVAQVHDAGCIVEVLLAARPLEDLIALGR